MKKRSNFGFSIYKIWQIFEVFRWNFPSKTNPKFWSFSFWEKKKDLAQHSHLYCGKNFLGKKNSFSHDHWVWCHVFFIMARDLQHTINIRIVPGNNPAKVVPQFPKFFNRINAYKLEYPDGEVFIVLGKTSSRFRNKNKHIKYCFLSTVAILI